MYFEKILFPPKLQCLIQHHMTSTPINGPRTVSFFLDCRRNNQQTKTDRFTERSAIKTPRAFRGSIAGNSWKRKNHCMFRIFSPHTRAEKQKESAGTRAKHAQMVKLKNPLISFLQNLLPRKCQSPLPLAFAFLLLQDKCNPCMPLKNSIFSVN